MIETVFIDIDNTLLDFGAYVKNSMREGFKLFGLRKYEEWMYEDVFRPTNGSLWKRIEAGELTLPDIRKFRWNLIFEKLGIDFDGPTFETYFRDRLFTSAVLVEGAEEAVRYLAGKYALCAASNGPFEQQRNRLRLSGLWDCFEEVYVSEGVGSQKPSREFFSYCINDLESKTGRKTAPENILMLGDSLSSDIRGGIDSGLKTCWFNPEKVEKPVDMRIDYEINSLYEVKNFL